MTISSVLHSLRIRPDGHHATAPRRDVRVVHRRQLHSCLIIHLTLPYVRTVKHITLVVEAHQPILLLSYLILLEVCAALTLVAAHLLPYVPLIWFEVLLRDVCVALSVCGVQTLVVL